MSRHCADAPAVLPLSNITSSEVKEWVRDIDLADLCDGEAPLTVFDGGWCRGPRTASW